MKCGWGLFLLALVCSVQAFAGDLDRAFTEMRRRGIYGENAKDVGQLCEHLARLELEKQYSTRQFDLQIGISYGPSRGAVKGELDVIVFNRGTEQAVLLAEVKCWDNIYEAASKARKQRRRFVKAMESGEFVGFYRDRETFERRRFEPVPQFILIAQQGSERAGFDLAMEYSLEEVNRLLVALRRCDTLEECGEILHPNCETAML